MIQVDEIYMRRALQLAALGRGFVSPNPMVGAVVVHNGKIIGEGFHRTFGKAHAEVNAIAAVADRSLLADSTIYVTLEPCSHYGKTPPCAKLIIDSKIPRVVVGTLDPYVKVSGRGVNMLREAGVEVVVGVLEDECRAINKTFMTANTLRRPFVQLKWAQSSDGFMGATDRRVTFSNPLTMALMHRERSFFDAILVGAGTVRTDNPSLTLRHWTGRNPLRIVLGDNIPSDATVITDGNPTIVYSSQPVHKVGNVEYVCINPHNVEHVLSDLFARGITSVMVEGGAAILSSFISAELFDEIRVETAPVQLTHGIKAPTFTAQQTSSTTHHDNIITYYKPKTFIRP